MLQYYKRETLGIQKGLERLMNSGFLAGTGKLAIYPVDHGFEHGPLASFTSNMEAMDPLYHFELAQEVGFSAVAAPLGFLEQGQDFKESVPLILKLTSSTLFSSVLDQAETGTVDDAVRLGCIGVGLTIYPGSPYTLKMIERAKSVIAHAREKGLFTVLWCYPRGPELKGCETAVDVIAYAAHIGVLLGAHVIKVKLPVKPVILERHKDICVKDTSLADRVRLVVQACFDGRRMVVFSGGAFSSEQEMMEGVQAIIQGGGHGSIMGRNVFQRGRQDAVALSKQILDLYGAAK